MNPFGEDLGAELKQKSRSEQEVPTIKKTPRRGARGFSVFIFGETFAGGRGPADLIPTKHG